MAMWASNSSPQPMEALRICILKVVLARPFLESVPVSTSTELTDSMGMIAEREKGSIGRSGIKDDQYDCTPALESQPLDNNSWGRPGFFMEPAAVRRVGQPFWSFRILLAIMTSL